MADNKDRKSPTWVEDTAGPVGLSSRGNILAGKQRALVQAELQKTAKYSQPTERYENLHLFDPRARCTWVEEMPLINKNDWKVTQGACAAFFALDLQDDGSLRQANTDNFTKTRMGALILSGTSVHFPSYALADTENYVLVERSVRRSVWLKVEQAF
ncbi:hypothetical protein DL768_007908 [Monosporascus sp. mg162]|nr:hypothetical protein DL768_007908 [Monosporascus sp. mg162]